MGFCVSSFLCLFLAFSLSLSSFLGSRTILEKEVPVFAFSITKKRKMKNTIEKYPTVILQVRKEVKESVFSVPLEGILSSEGAWVRNDRILILRLRVDILGLHSLPLPQFVSHFLTHSVSPTLITLFSISSFLWLLLLQFIFTHEESINHLIVRYKNISNSF